MLTLAHPACMSANVCCWTGYAFTNIRVSDTCGTPYTSCRRKEGPGVVVAGRTVDVDLALGHDDIRSLAAQKASERGPRDKRNLYLVRWTREQEGGAWAAGACSFLVPTG